jgi:ABC-type transport system involved in cytochrome c biogenesis permease subunit
MSAHELSNLMLYVHPPLAIAGYFAMGAFTLLLFKKKESSIIKRVGISAWALSFLGLITGMYWAQIAWGSYWSWDPKETLSLIMFLLVSASVVSHNEGKGRLAKVLSILTLVSIVVTILSSYLILGLHSFAG